MQNVSDAEIQAAMLKAKNTAIGLAKSAKTMGAGCQIAKASADELAIIMRGFSEHLQTVLPSDQCANAKIIMESVATAVAEMGGTFTDLVKELGLHEQSWRGFSKTWDAALTQGG